MCYRISLDILIYVYIFIVPNQVTVKKFDVNIEHGIPLSEALQW